MCSLLLFFIIVKMVREIDSFPFTISITSCDQRLICLLERVHAVKEKINADCVFSRK